MTTTTTVPATGPRDDADESMSALDAVEMGVCAGSCMVADPDTVDNCDCRCTGRYHGVLSHVELTNLGRPKFARLRTERDVSPRDFTDDEEQRIRELHAAGYGRNAIARELGRSKAGITGVTRRLGLTFPAPFDGLPPAPGFSSPKAAVWSANLKAIRALADSLLADGADT